MPAVDVGTAAVLLSVLVAFAFAELVVLFAPRAMAAVASVNTVAKSIFVDVVKAQVGRVVCWREGNHGAFALLYICLGLDILNVAFWGAVLFLCSVQFKFHSLATLNINSSV